ncbi:MAG: zinc ABC transporter substrate-binding protein [Rhodospirillaceae bacterium]
MFLILGRGLAAAVVLSASAIAPAAAAPKVAVSINPIHSLVAAVMKDVGEPALLLRGAASPHTYALRPSDARTIAESDVVIRVGRELEGFLDRPLASLAAGARAVTLMDDADLVLYPARAGGAWEDHAPHGHDHERGPEDADGGMDPHVWLDPGNAARIVAHVAGVLRSVDPSNADAYRRNEAAAIARLRAMEDEIDAGLAPVRTAPFAVFHDAYQYLERRYGLNAVGSVVVSPEQRPSAKRLRALRARIVKLGARCVFAEPQFQPPLVAAVAEDTPARIAVLDPEGAAIPPGPDAYFVLMRGLRESLVGCLGAGG